MTAAGLRAQLKQLLLEQQQPTIADLVTPATVLALREHPHLNATFEDGRLQVHQAVHVGLAVDADEGLIVPVVRNADQLPLPRLAEETKRLAQRARDNQVALDDLRGGTFTVTSLGPQGEDFFTPIINPPQVAILGIDRLFAKLVLEQDRPIELQARFRQSVKRYLELPVGLMV